MSKSISHCQVNLKKCLILALTVLLSDSVIIVVNDIE